MHLDVLKFSESWKCCPCHKFKVITT